MTTLQLQSSKSVGEAETQASAFAWRMQRGEVFVSVEDGVWLPCCKAQEVAEQMSIWDFYNYEVGDHKVEVGYPNGMAEDLLYWRAPRSPFVERRSGDSRVHEQALVEQDREQENILLSRLAELCNMRIAAPLWRGLAGNVVFHQLVGFGYAVASDGARVLVLQRPRLIAPVFVAHRTNVIGCVSSTPCSPSSWDWAKNRKRFQVARRSPAAKKEQRAVNLLESILNS